MGEKRDPKPTDQVSFLDELVKPVEVKSVEVKPATKSIEPKIWTVSEFAKDLRDHLRDHYHKVLIKGEICDFKGVHRNGHLYMGLKDDNAQMRVVIWKGVVQKIPFDLTMGLEVIVAGTIDFYGGSGSLQVVADSIEPLGIGSLQLKFEQLKDKLQKEGLFEASRKKPLPDIVSRIALITGESTAALQDMLRIFAQRYPLVELYFFQASVQGEQAPREVISALKRVERFSIENKVLDLVIIARGGGSYEDLFCFNNEEMVRAIANCSLPTLSAVGHEIDFTICDFVADHRSATPTHAASESVPDIRFVTTQLSNAMEGFRKCIRLKINDYIQKLDHLLSQVISKAPHNRLKVQSQMLQQTSTRLKRAIEVRIDRMRALIQGHASVLDAISPLKVFERGYSLVQNDKGEVIRDKSKITIGELLKIKFHQGEAHAEVKKISSNTDRLPLDKSGKTEKKEGNSQ